MATCCIKSCRNHYYTVKLARKDVSYYRFPMDPALREAWLRNISDDVMPLFTGSVVCSAHFTNDCFKFPGEPKDHFNWKSCYKTKRMIPGSVPTLRLNPSQQGSDDANEIDSDVARRRLEFHMASLNRSKKDQFNTNQVKVYHSKRSNAGTRRNLPISHWDMGSMIKRSRGSSKVKLEQHYTACNLQTIKKKRSNENNDDLEEYNGEEEVPAGKRTCRSMAEYSNGYDNANEDEDENLLAKISELKRVNNELLAKLQAANEEKKRSKPEVTGTVESVLKPYFTASQIECIIEGRKCGNWSIDDYAAAISLRSISTKAYCYMRNKLNFPLPSLPALRKWALFEFDIREGFLNDVFAIMKEKSKSLTAIDKIAVLTFGEMALNPEISLDSKSEKLIGPCENVQVIMVRGLFGNWQQPIYYKFDQSITKEILCEALTRLDETGYQVIATTCETSHLGPEGIFAQLGITVDNHFFPHPSIHNAVVYVFVDVPHLLKSMRNWLMDEGFFLHSCKEKFTADIFQTLVNLRSKGDLCASHQITQFVLDARNNLKEAVWPAAHIWSHSAGKAIQLAGDQGLLETTEYAKFADFVLTVNSWFDVQNSLRKYGQHSGVNGFGIDLDQQERVLLLMTLYMQHMRVGSQTSLMPFQQGVIISNASLRGLYKNLQNKYSDKFECLMTRRLQMDVLHNFYFYIRAVGGAKDDPCGYEFQHRLRCYILGKYRQSIFSVGRNCEEESSIHRLSLSPPRLSLDYDTVPVQDSSSPLPVLAPCSSNPEDCDFTIKPDIENILNNCDTTSIRSGISSTHYSCTIPEYDIEPNPPAEVVLTQELFMSINIISPDELAEDLADESTSKNLDDDSPETSQQDNDEDTDELYKISLIHFLQEPSATLGCRNGVDESQEVRIKYLAGYIARKFINKYRFLGEPGDQVDEVESNEQLDWTQTIPKDHFVEPSKTLLDLARAAEICFIGFHGKRFSKEDQVIQKVVRSVKNSVEYTEWIPEEVLQCLVRTRTYLRVRELNKRAHVNGEEETAEEKIEKVLTNWEPCATRTLQHVNPEVSN